MPGMSVPGLPIKKLGNNEVDELYDNKGSVYFANIFGDDCIVVNMLTDKEDILLEHRPARVTCKNLGGSIQSMRIEQVVINFTNGAEKVLLGNPRKYECQIGKNETFSFYLDEVSNGSNAMCKINEEILEIMRPGLNIIGTDFNSYIFDYTKAIMRITFYNEIGSYTYDIGVQKSNNKLIAINERVG